MTDPNAPKQYSSIEYRRYTPEDLQRQRRRDVLLSVILGLLITYLLHPPFTEVINIAADAVVDLLVGSGIFES